MSDSDLGCQVESPACLRGPRSATGARSPSGHGEQEVIVDSYESVDEVDREADYYEACEPVPNTEVEVCRGREYNDQDALRFPDRKLHYLIVIDKEAGGTEALSALTWTPLSAVLNP